MSRGELRHDGPADGRPHGRDGGGGAVVPPLLLLLPLGSGVSALVYEIVWFGQLELAVGSSAVSLGIVLATFMGGTSAGSLLFPRVVPAGKNPLFVYAGIEAGIAVFGILTLFTIPQAGTVYASWAGDGLTGFLLRGAVSGVCLLPGTFLMGATLPALARQIGAGNQSVPWIGLCYGANVIGGVAGCLLAAFWLLRVYDVVIASLWAAGLNILVAGLALAFSQTRLAECGPVRAESIPRSGDPRIYWVLAASGFSALSAEVIWTRTLGLLFGASVYSFAIILAVFLLGLGLGSGVGSWLSGTTARSGSRASMRLGVCQCLLGGGIAWTSWSVSAALPYWPIDPAISSDIAFNFQLDLVRAVWALLPPTLLWGASFPLALAALVRDGEDRARPVGRAWAINSVGAVAGALSTSLFLYSGLGSQGTSRLLIALSTAAGLALILQAVPGPQVRFARRRKAGIAALLAVSSAVGIAVVPPVNALLIAHGRYAASWLGRSEILEAREGLNASVAVSRFPGGILAYHVAGKIQASTAPRDLRLQRMLGHLTTLSAATPASVLVIGFGAGVTAGAVSIDPAVDRVTVVEIESLVPPTAAAWLGRYNFDVAENPRVGIVIDDGRHYLLTREERFDAITADPLDPWVRGAANLYTVEFLEAARDRLNPGGVLTMYVQLFETTPEAVRSSLATFFEVFPDGLVWANTREGRGYDLVLLGRLSPVAIDLDDVGRRLARSDYAPVAQSLREVGIDSAVELFATYAGRGPDLGGWLEGAPINRDRNLHLQYLAGLGLNLDESASIYSGMLAYRRFPEDLFTGTEGHVGQLRLLLQSQAPVQP